MENQKLVPAWVTFLGLILFLLGIYGSVRTAVNLVAFPRYPSSGVYYFNLSGFPSFTNSESDCETGYGIMPLAEPGKDVSLEEKEKQIQACLSGVREGRAQAKVTDISQSFLFLFLGLGVLLTRKSLFSL